MSEGNASFVDFKAIKHQVSIVQILDRYDITQALASSGNGDRLSGACPLHGGSNKTHFRVSVSKNCWNCFGSCRGGGNILDFVSKKENVPIREAALLIQEWFPTGSGAEKPEPKAQADKASIQLIQEARSTKEEEITVNKPLEFALKHLDPTHPYLSERRLSAETITEFGLGFCSKGLLKGRIAIPIHNAEGNLVAYAGRWPGDPPQDTPKYRLPAGFRKALELFNLHRAMKEPQDAPLVIVEGFFDCMMLWQHGVRKVVALMGSSLSDAQEMLVARIATPYCRVVVMLDEDEAGRVGREDIARRIASGMFVKVWQFEQEGQQPDQLGAQKLAATGLIGAYGTT